ncbi:peptidyl-prolyl cis-trans isomerase A (cyclophilin A) [Sphingomonas leidyi]|uniref:Peptidyl-prolyl cis-trans isomerase A (Cyclophilin A) n=1 Tax=Sphingomonas leidyi TaxID=68569 RepID=A0A7X5ZU79_9SPHN|nr:peptidylprolyl isomerase [Sphingomonas leidyi]NIJ63822.1 peptidyl-prolyl cis-trans isomerase A (cyclophilin A) [Sphingomonas leidyi]
MRWIAACLLSLVALPVLAQTAPAPSPAAPLPRVALTTAAGTIVVEVDTVHAPISGNNFLRYIDQKRLDGAPFYRVVKVQDHFGFVQFGVNNARGKVLPPIKHEPTTLTGIKHTDFTLSTPRRAPGTAAGDFTILLGDQPSFDADPTKPGDNLGYAAFAHVVDGKDVVLKVFDAPNSPTATLGGYFKGEIPAAPVKILTARRVAN